MQNLVTCDGDFGKDIPFYNNCPIAQQAGSEPDGLGLLESYFFFIKKKAFLHRKIMIWSEFCGILQPIKITFIKKLFSFSENFSFNCAAKKCQKK
jgi:hypothetical protein